ncbi:MAG: M23 family metallopeptidase, partial [Candidatus Levybacteria bacterium]|nr:M23 family metallopeptidase [Candidatus Levybacteria bacterium]
TFSLVEGQIVVVPDGVKPEEQPTYVRPRRQLAAGPSEILASGFAWPASGYISQGYTWYHPGIDIAADYGTPIVAATNGTVSEVYSGGWNGGYGIYVTIAGANASTTLYSHLSATNVNPGDTVTGGKTTIGWIGMTGRTTGPHVHFEVRTSGGSTNPLSVLN